MLGSKRRPSPPRGRDRAQKGRSPELSPFEVKATSDSNAYTADSTLAGNRLSTQLRDIGSSVTVVTSQFLMDTGATDNTSLLQRLGGTEVGGVNGNYASPGTGSSATLLTEDTIKPTEGTRIRGLAAADNARDFFLTDIPWDSYNVDRIDISRGPNAILFGEGSPAGIINATTKSAAFNNSGNVDFRFGSFGSVRGERGYQSSDRAWPGRHPARRFCTMTKNMNRSRPIRRTSAYPVRSASNLLS